MIKPQKPKKRIIQENRYPIEGGTVISQDMVGKIVELDTYDYNNIEYYVSEKIEIDNPHYESDLVDYQAKVKRYKQLNLDKQEEDKKLLIKLAKKYPDIIKDIE